MTAPHPLSRTVLLLSVFALTVVLPPAARAAVAINVNYSGGANATMNGYYSTNTEVAGTASRVAPLAYDGTTWTDLTSPSAGNANLPNSDGTLSGVSLTTTMLFGPWNDWTGLGTNRMLVSGVLAGYTTYTPIFTLSGLDLGHSYDLYIACLHNAISYRAHFLVGATSNSAAHAGATDWTDGQNYVRLANLVPQTNGQLVVNAKCGGSWEGIVLNGFQLQDMGPRGLSSEALFYSFEFPGIGPATINGTNITIMAPFGTDPTALAPTYVPSVGATVNKASGSTHDFSSPVCYGVTSEDSSTFNEYCVTVTVLPEMPTVINVNYYGGSVPGNAYMDGISSLDPTARGSASQVAPRAYSGTNWNDFNYSSASSSNLRDSLGALTAVGFSTSMGGGPWNDWTGLGVNRMLVSGLVANYSSYTDILTINGLDPTHAYDLYIASLHNALNRNTDFMVGAASNNVSYTGATDWSNRQNYAYFASVVPSPGGVILVRAKTPTGEIVLNGFQLQDMGLRGTNSDVFIYSFTFPGLGDAAIDGTNITIAVPFGTDVTALSPTYLASAGATVDKPSGSTWNFAVPVVYTVVAEDSSRTNEYTVHVMFLSITSMALDVSDTGTGLDILNDGILVAANHFGATTVTPVTLDNGLAFGTNRVHMTSGWAFGGQWTDTDAHGYVPLIVNANFGALMRSYKWHSNNASYINIPGLLPGHTYRLQLISSNPQYCDVSVDGSSDTRWTNLPSVLTAIWTAKDDTANVVFSRTGGEIEFNGYALHDISSVMAFVDITNIDVSVDVPFGTTSFPIAGTNTETTVGDLWWSVSPGGSSDWVPAHATGWTFMATALQTGPNIVTVSGSNETGTIHQDSVTVNVIPEPVAAGAAIVIGCSLFVIRKKQ